MKRRRNRTREDLQNYVAGRKQCSSELKAVEKYNEGRGGEARLEGEEK